MRRVKSYKSAEPCQNHTALCRFLAVTVAERAHGAPWGIHDPALFIDPRALAAECARYGVVLEVRGIRPTALPMLRWIVRRTGEVPIVPSRIKAVLYQGRGVKQ